MKTRVDILPMHVSKKSQKCLIVMCIVDKVGLKVCSDISFITRNECHFATNTSEPSIFEAKRLIARRSQTKENAVKDHNSFCHKKRANNIS